MTAKSVLQIGLRRGEQAERQNEHQETFHPTDFRPLSPERVLLLPERYYAHYRRRD